MTVPLLSLLRALSRPDTASDVDLLDRFGRSHDDAAFSELVRRHGPAVYRICRRLVGPAAVDDAFQATFLVLSTRLEAARAAASVGNWLVGTAGRVARQMRRAANRRAWYEAGAARTPGTASEPALDRLDDCRVLDEELALLPDRLRAPVVICLLQGHPQEYAAGVLGQTVRTVRRRLREAKQLLRIRLERRGVAPAVAAGLVASAGPVADALTADLIHRTSITVFGFLTGRGTASSRPVVLAKGVAMAMRIRRAILVGVVATLGLTAVGIGLAGAGKPAAAPTIPLSTGEAGPVPPDLSDDVAFLRQLCLETRGTPPTVVETAYFLPDRDPKKRPKVTGWVKADTPDFSLQKRSPYVIEPPDNLLIEAVLRSPVSIPESDRKRGQDGQKSAKESVESLPLQPISGAFQVRPDGTVGLGFWGSVSVAGLTLDQATAVIRQHLIQSESLKKSEAAADRLLVSVDVLAANSKRYYVICDGPNGKEMVLPFPDKGNETVLDVVPRAPRNDPPGTNARVPTAGDPPATKRVQPTVWIGRGQRVLLVDWAGIMERGDSRTNYQLQPGDRVYVKYGPPASWIDEALSISRQGETDRAFLSRVCLSLRGTPPTTVETEYFLADTDPAKKEKVVRLLTAGPGNTTPDRAGPSTAIEVIARDGKVYVSGRTFRAVARSFRLAEDGRTLEFTGTDDDPVKLDYRPVGEKAQAITGRRVVVKPSDGRITVEGTVTIEGPGSVETERKQK